MASTPRGLEPAGAQRAVDLELLLFTLEERDFALPLGDVGQVLRAVEITPLPEPDDLVLGVIDVRTQLVPVLALRRLLGLPERETEVHDRLIIVSVKEWEAALLVDHISGVGRVAHDDVVDSDSVLPGANLTMGMVKVGGKMIPLFEASHLASRVQVTG